MSASANITQVTTFCSDKLSPINEEDGIKILLYFPYRKVGGVSILFSRLAAALADNQNVFLVDFNDGYMGKNLPVNVHLIDFEHVDQYPDKSILVLQSLPPWNLVDIEKFPPETRIFFWNLHPQNLYPNIFSTLSSNRIYALVARFLLPLSYLRRKKMRSVVKFLNEKNAITFMDGENYDQTCSYYPGISIRRNLLPILTSVNQLSIKKENGPMQCCWVGRVVDFKVHILIHLAKRLDNAVSKLGAIKLSIIGEGEMLPFFKNHVRDIKSIQIEYLPELSVDQLDKYIRTEVDVMFAMGTSALEGASRAVPTFLLDYSYKPINFLYKFRYLYEVEHYSLAEMIRKESHCESSSSLENKLIEIIEGEAKVGLCCYQYWSENHSPASVCRNFIKQILSSEATIGDMKKREFFVPDVISKIIKRWSRKIRGGNLASGMADN